MEEIGQPIPEPEPVRRIEEPKPAKVAPMDFSDISLDTPLQVSADPDPGPTPEIELAPPTSILDDEKPASPAPRPAAPANGANGHPAGGKVHRWTIRAVLSDYTMRRLHAVCILAEGDVPLRIVTPAGQVLVGEDAGMTVNPSEFDVLSRVFGL